VDALSDTESRFAERAMRRERLFLVLALAGVAVAGGLAVLYGILAVRHPGSVGAARWVVVLLVLLNARQNLRQVRYARVLRALLGRGA